MSQEKREGTLGLLFLTSLKGYDVILGKLAATSLNGFYGLLSVFPVWPFRCCSEGSVAPVLARGLITSERFLYSLAIGMLVSALSRETSRSMGDNLVLLLVPRMSLESLRGFPK